MMKLRIKYDVGSWIMGKYYGKVLYPFMLFSEAQEDVNDRLFRHELEHVYQIRRMGWLVFYVKYLWLLLRNGYDNHPFELEAKARQYDPLTDKERRLKDGS